MNIDITEVEKALIKACLSSIIEHYDAWVLMQKHFVIPITSEEQEGILYDAAKKLKHILSQ